MKIIFLAIDGVLDSYQSSIYYNEFLKGHKPEHGFCPMALSNLQYLISFTDCKIVLVNDWKENADFTAWPVINDAIIDKIIASYDIPEIERWVLDNHVSKYAIVNAGMNTDDVPEYFHINALVGLDLIMAKEIAQYLNS